jgi:hypothetical protein
MKIEKITYDVFIGASSELCTFFLKDNKNSFNNIILIARDKKKLNSLLNDLNNHNVRIIIIDLSCDKSIDSLINKLRKIKIKNLFYFAGVNEPDKDFNISNNSIWLNALLPVILQNSNLNFKKFINISSLFAYAPKKGRLIYSYTKLIPLLLNSKKVLNVILGPIYSKKTSIPFFLAENKNNFSKKLYVNMKNNKFGNIYIPRFWYYFLPLLRIINRFL